MSTVICGDSIKEIKKIKDDSIHLILSDIPYGISYDKWDILHNNTNSALLGASPTQKPISLMKYLIELTTIEGQTVLDPFCGCGSTLQAAKELGREYIGIEINPIYYETVCKRLDIHKDK